MNNNNNNNNKDLNYLLFKKIINNIYLYKLIFQFVKELNYKEIYNFLTKYNKNINNKNNEKLKEQIEKEINSKFKFKYNEIPFRKIFEFELVGIFQDKLKTKQIVNETQEKIVGESCCNNFGFIYQFLQFYKRSKISFREFQEFYSINRSILLKSELDYRTGRKKDLFEYLVERKEYQLLKWVYQNLKKEIDTEKQYYYKIKQERIKELEQYGYNLQIVPTDFKEYEEQVKSPFTIYFNNQLIRIAFQSSSIEIVEFLYEVVQLDFEHHNKDLLYWAIQSDQNQLEMVNFLFDRMNYKFPRIHCGSFDNYFHYLLSLNYSTFKRVLESGSPLFIKPICFNEKLVHSSSSQLIKYDLIQIIIHSHFHNNKTKLNYLIILKLIKKLLKFNSSNNNHNNNNNHIITNQYLKKLIFQSCLKSKYQPQLIQLPSQEQQELQKKNENSLINNLINTLFSNHHHHNNNNHKHSHHKNNITTKHNKNILNSELKYYYNRYSTLLIINNNNSGDNKTIKEKQKEKEKDKYLNIKPTGFEEFLKIDYKNFNLEKEIFKLFILEFLTSFQEIEKFDLMSMILNYCSKYQEFKILEKYINSNDDQELRFKINQTIYYYILNFANLNLYYHCKQNNLISNFNNNNNNNNDGDFDMDNDNNLNINLKNINNYIKLLSLFNQYNDPLFEKLFFKLINLQDLQIDSINLLINVLKEYYLKNNNSNNLNSNNLKNQFSKNLIFNNFNQLFNW